MSMCISCHCVWFCVVFFFFFNDTAITEIYTLSPHDALPIWLPSDGPRIHRLFRRRAEGHQIDRKSTRLNSSHLVISYAVFCSKKKKNTDNSHPPDHSPTTNKPPTHPQITN